MTLITFKSFFCNKFRRNIVHCFYYYYFFFFFCLYISQPQNVLNLFLFFDQYQPRCSYKVCSYKKVWDLFFRKQLRKRVRFKRAKNFCSYKTYYFHACVSFILEQTEIFPHRYSRSLQNNKFWLNLLLKNWL